MHLRRKIMDCSNLTFNISNQSGLSSLSGPAKDILAADLGNTSLKIETILAACARPFMDGLHTSAFLQSPRDYLGDRFRFDGNAWLRFPNELALRYGAVRFSLCLGYAINACALIIGGQRAVDSMSPSTGLHPALAAIDGVRDEQKMKELLEQAGTDLQSTLGGVLIRPNEKRDGFEIIWWHEDFHTARNLRVSNPKQTIADASVELAEELSRRLETTRLDDLLTSALQESRATARDTLAKLRRTEPATTADFINSILPLEFQAALAYEGLYFNHTHKTRTPNLPVRFASSEEHSYEGAWADLFNNLVAKFGANSKTLGETGALPRSAGLLAK